jgi:hypothetical protein
MVGITSVRFYHTFFTFLTSGVFPMHCIGWLASFQPIIGQSPVACLSAHIR